MNSIDLVFINILDIDSIYCIRIWLVEEIDFVPKFFLTFNWLIAQLQR